jgi:hypothetical protein
MQRHARRPGDGASRHGFMDAARKVSAIPGIRIFTERRRHLQVEKERAGLPFHSASRGKIIVT